MKKDLRNRILESRMKMSSMDVDEKSRAILARLRQQAAWLGARMVMTYVAFRNEVHTDEMIRGGLAEGKRVAVPLSLKDPVQLIPSEIKEYPGDLAAGTWGIMEPRPGKLNPVDPSQIDLVLVPGVVFDQRGNRLGYGAGYYDRFLSSLRPDATAIALAFELQVQEEVYPEPHDRPVHLIITEERVIDCAGNRVRA